MRIPPIKIRIVGSDSFPVELVNFITAEAEKAAYKLEKKLFDEIVDLIERNKLTNDPNLLDAARFRFQEAKGQAIQIQSVEQGSLELTLVITAISCWVLSKTLGRSVEQAWDDSEMNKRVKRMIRRNVDFKGINIAKEIKKTLTRRFEKKKSKAPIESQTLNETEQPLSARNAVEVFQSDEQIEIVVHANFDKPIPETYWEMFGKEFDYAALEERN